MINWPIRWTNGAAWRSWEKWNTNIATCCKIDTNPYPTISTRIRQPFSCPIRIRSSSEKSYSWRQKSTSAKRERTALEGYNTSSVKAWKNVNQTNVKNSFPTSNWLAAGPASPQLPIDSNANSYKLISAATAQKWKFLPPTKKQKDPFPHGLVQLSWAPCASSTNG